MNRSAKPSRGDEISSGTTSQVGFHIARGVIAITQPRCNATEFRRLIPGDFERKQ
jgi:hypothetical protein